MFLHPVFQFTRYIIHKTTTGLTSIISPDSEMRSTIELPLCDNFLLPPLNSLVGYLSVFMFMRGCRYWCIYRLVYALFCVCVFVCIRRAIPRFVLPFVLECDIRLTFFFLVECVWLLLADITCTRTHTHKQVSTN